ncbi:MULTISPECIES: NUDIX hydrolase [Olivibacter]|nr:NUDIX domain-containing protein [Olivibacter sp. LS-1]
MMEGRTTNRFNMQYDNIVFNAIYLSLQQEIKGITANAIIINNMKASTNNQTIPINLPTAGLIVIKDNKLLLAFSKNKKAWYLPGGKVDAGETSIQSLQREIREELNIELKTELLTFYCHIKAAAYGEPDNVIMTQDCFLYELHEQIEASNEIEAVAYFSYKNYLQEAAVVGGVVEVFENLTRDCILQ